MSWAALNIAGKVTHAQYVVDPEFVIVICWQIGLYFVVRRRENEVCLRFLRYNSVKMRSSAVWKRFIVSILLVWSHLRALRIKLYDDGCGYDGGTICYACILLLLYFRVKILLPHFIKVDSGNLLQFIYLSYGL